MRKLSKPENYSSPKDAAQSLREVAETIERGPEWVNYSINFWFATKEEVAVGMQRRQTRREK